MKKSLNLDLLEFHVREAAGELDSLLSRIQFMLGRLDKAGELQVDAWGDLNEAGLEVSLAHAYHHMNFAWNVRNKTTKEADACAGVFFKLIESLKKGSVNDGYFH